ncbi:MAG: hypothetical protein LQ346_001099 [Caloplaca aetnensis]|nr:MAG: hypothetical protein LQ346_001099 [Caloplaca aetnensis]
MIGCHDCQLSPKTHYVSVHSSKYEVEKQYPEQSFQDHGYYISKGALELHHALEASNTTRQTMRSGKDAAPVRQQKRSQQTVIRSPTDRWYGPMNEIGADAPPIPFIDGMTNLRNYTCSAETLPEDPPFFLQKPSLDDESIQATQTERLSSRPGLSSQPPPLSHSLLSQLELGENDPDTFREIIDDLTVQNKKLRGELKKYQRAHNNSSKSNGLFEVRVRNLPAKKKHELENILQNFASTVQLSPHGLVQEPSILGSSRPTEALVTADGRSSSSSPYVQTLDSAYASVSTTGGTFKQPSGRIKNRTRMQADHTSQYASQTLVHRTSREIRSPNLDGIVEKSRQQMVVTRLEELFVRPNVYRAALEDAQSLSRAPGQSSQGSGCPEPPGGKSVMDGLPGLRQSGATSALGGTSPPLQHDWIYLNLLVNMAQLHVLNVIPEFVRQSIRDYSTRLQLSDDGGKVRWQGSPLRAVDMDYRSTGLASRDANHSANPESNHTDQLQHRYDLALSAPEQNPSPPAGEIEFPKRAETFSSLAPREVPATKLHYKPLFAHEGRRSGSDRSSRDSSCDSSSPCSETEEDEAKTRNFIDGSDPSNGALVFFDQDPFFLDTSGDRPDPDCITHPSCSSPIKEPLGDPRARRISVDSDEKKHDAVFAACSSDEERWRNASPVLRIYKYNQSSTQQSDDEEGPIHLEASGIGGIQLDDNFAISVRGLHAAVPSGANPRSPVRHRLRNTIPDEPSRTPTQSQSRHIISTTTTHLPPSPLPPPSYVYPTHSSSSSESDEGDSLLDDIDSDSELEFRRVSLSPQMRMFLEQQEPPSLQVGIAGGVPPSTSDGDYVDGERGSVGRGDEGIGQAYHAAGY